MRIGILGDLQLTNKAPKRRIDDYWATLQGKLIDALAIFEAEECDHVVQVGDFFDSPAVANKVQSRIIQILYGFGLVDEKNIWCVYGQHDISGHSKSTLPNSPLAVLQSARVVNILNNLPQLIEPNIHLYGASFGELIPEPENRNFYNILVMHKMIGDRKLWPRQELSSPREFLRKHPGYNLVCCGDYHYRCIEKWKDQVFINPGAIVRKTIGKFDLEHKPAVVVFDTDRDYYKVIELGVRPPEKVFDFTESVKKKDNKILADLVDKLKSGGKKLSEWKQFLVKVLDERKSSEKVRDIIDQSLDKIRRQDG